MDKIVFFKFKVKVKHKIYKYKCIHLNIKLLPVGNL
jgi:hypothetical protein